MVAKYIKKVKEWCQENKKDIFVALLIFLTSMASFGLGRLSIIWPTKEPITIENAGIAGTVQNVRDVKTDFSASPISNAQGKYVASKTGTAYHFPWCPGAQKIKESNKVWFETEEEAEKKGYKPAGNCPGL